MQSKPMRFNFGYQTFDWVRLSTFRPRGGGGGTCRIHDRGVRLGFILRTQIHELETLHPKNTWHQNFLPQKIQDLVQKLENWNLNLSNLFLKDSSSRKSIPRDFQWPSYSIIWNKLCSGQCCSASDGNTTLHAQVVIKIILNNILNVSEYLSLNKAQNSKWMASILPVIVWSVFTCLLVILIQHKSFHCSPYQAVKPLFIT